MVFAGAPETSGSGLPVRYADVAAAAERLAGHAHRTPVMTSRTVVGRFRGGSFHFGTQISKPAPDYPHDGPGVSR
jgi:hypothetical protein